MLYSTKEETLLLTDVSSEIEAKATAHMGWRNLKQSRYCEEQEENLQGMVEGSPAWYEANYQRKHIVCGVNNYGEVFMSSGRF